MAHLLIPTDDGCACCGQWRQRYKLKCPHVVGQECVWEKDGDPERIDCDTSEADSEWVDEDECSGWIYGPRHEDCMPADSDVDENLLPDITELLCGTCCECGVWRRHYSIACPDPEADCSWAPDGDAEDVLCADHDYGDEFVTDEDGCGGWLYGPQHPDGALPGVPDLDMDNLPAISSGTCASCCGCRQWRRAYAITCADSPTGCTWEPAGAPALVDCTDHESEFVRDGCEGVLYGPQHDGGTAPAMSDLDVDLLPDTTEDDCTGCCECVQWARRYVIQCGPDGDCEWAAAADPEVQYCGSYHDSFEVTGCTAVLYGPRHYVAAPETPDLNAALVVDPDCEACCECKQWKVRYRVTCDDDGVCSWAVDGDPELVACGTYGDEFVWEDDCAGLLYGAAHYGTWPATSDANPSKLPTIFLGTCNICCGCEQYVQNYRIECGDADGECELVPEGDPELWSCSFYENEWRWLTETTGRLYGPKHYGGAPGTPDVDTELVPALTADDCREACPCTQWRKPFKIQCVTQSECEWVFDGPATLGACSGYDDEFSWEPGSCNGILYGPKHFGAAPSGDDLNLAHLPTLGSTQCSVCCGDVWLIQVRRSCYWSCDANAWVCSDQAVECGYPVGWGTPYEQGGTCYVVGYGPCKNKDLPPFSGPPGPMPGRPDGCCDPTVGHWKSTGSVTFTPVGSPACLSTSFLAADTACRSGRPSDCARAAISGYVRVQDRPGSTACRDIGCVSGAPVQRLWFNATYFSLVGEVAQPDGSYRVTYAFEDCGLGTSDAAITVVMIPC